jgi:hypothetical protein
MSRFLNILFFIIGLPLCVSAATSADFIFVAEVPVYVPCISVEMDDLLQKEYEYLDHKRRFKQKLKCEAITEDEYSSDIEYVIRNKLRWDKKKRKYVDASPQWRGSFKTYDTKKKRIPTSIRMNEEHETTHIKKLIDLFANESFGVSDEESQAEFQQRMRLAILANRPKSVLSIRNSSLKTAHNDSRAVVIKGAWAPQWEYRKGRGHFSKVPYTKVRRYVRYCLLKWNQASTIEVKEKWKNKIISVLEQEEYNVGEHVPYHELRECLRTDPLRNRFVRTFVDLHPNARLYEATHDNDLVRLRIVPDRRPVDQHLLNSTGLYTHYLDILRRLSTTKAQLPDVLTTEYRIAYEPDRFKDEEEYAWLYQVIEEDRYARAAASTVDFRAAYIAEPNCLYLVPKGLVSIPYRFLSLPNGTRLRLDGHNEYDPCESMAIMCQMYSANPRVTVHFDPTHPVLMKIPPRMLNYKKSKSPIKTGELGRYDSTTDRFEVSNLATILTLSSSVSQSPFAYRDYAVTLYRQLGLNDGYFSCIVDTVRVKVSYPNAVFCSLIPTIFNYFDLKNFIEHNRVLVPPNHLNFTYLEKRSESDPENGHLVKRLNDINRLQSAAEQLTALQALMNEIYGSSIGDIVVKIAEQMGKARQKHYRAYLLAEPEMMSLRTSPQQAMTQSPGRIQPATVKVERESSGSVRKDLFGVRHLVVEPKREEQKEVDHEYTDRDIVNLLECTIALYDEVVSTEVGNVYRVATNFYVLPPIHVRELTSFLRDHFFIHLIVKTYSPKALIIPLNMEHHWVTLYIYISNADPINVWIIDSRQSRELYEIPELCSFLEEKYKDKVNVHMIAPRLQPDSLSCGPIMMENICDLIRLRDRNPQIEVKTIGLENILEIRKQHQVLLETKHLKPDIPTAAASSEVKQESNTEHSSSQNPISHFVERFFQQDYTRELVTIVLQNLSNASDLAAKIGKDRSMISKLKKLEKYGNLDPSAQLIWGLFHNKSIREIKEIMGVNDGQLEAFAHALEVDD